MSAQTLLHGLLGAVLFWPCAASLCAEEPTSADTPAAELEFFEQHIRPVLVEHCYACHSAEAQAQNKLKGGLLLDSRQGVLRGGDSGPAAAPGEVDDSLLLQALRYESFEMPPSGQLSETVIANFKSWIERGLPDPRSEERPVPPSQIDMTAGRQHWAYQPLQPVKLNSAPASAAISPIDTYVQERLRGAGLVGGPEADRVTLIRRLYFDLLGLPPRPADIECFVGDRSPLAYEKLVDRLLASPRFGERWGRHWLDIVRYADSITLRGFVLPHAWRYRDYVIDAFNEDRPWDVFLQEQIAGDLLTAATIEDRQRQLIATTFLTLGNTNLEDQDKEKLRMDVVDEQLETICRAFLAQTIGCARCHDHKFDPIPTRDYYALAGILHNTKTLEHANVSQWLEVALPCPPEQEASLRQHEQKLADLREQINQRQQQAEDDASAPKDDLRRLQRELKELENSGPQRPMTMSVREESEISDLCVQIRGDVHNLGPRVPRGFLQVVGGDTQVEFTDEQSGRLQLAEWLTDPTNPLTARVLANRIWHWLTGTGIVRTTDNFGAMGERPSHPALLDYLAVRLIQTNGSVKALIREIVLSRTYRQASTGPWRLTHAGKSVDPQNRLLWRMNRRRLDAECLLDAMLCVSGQLRLEMGGPTIRTGTRTDYDYDHQGTQRRAVYWPVLRNSLPPLFDVFDFANPSMVVGRRNQSSTAPQALFLMNNPFVMQQADATAQRLLSDDQCSDDGRRIDYTFRLVLGRPPQSTESRAILGFIERERRQPANPPRSNREIWAAIVHSLFGSIDFRYLE